MDPRLQLYCLVSIVARSRSAQVVRILREHGATQQHILQGRGTASSDLQLILGLGEPEKEIVFTLAPRARLDRILPALRAQLQLSQPGHGIVFTIPLSGINLHTAEQACCGLDADGSHKEDSLMTNEMQHDLIIAVVDDNDTDLVFEAARQAGCRGGTIAKARQAPDGEKKALFGLTFAPEKELVMIVAPRADKAALLKAISNRILQSTGEPGMVFSLPVADAMGLKKDAPREAQN